MYWSFWLNFPVKSRYFLGAKLVLPDTIMVKLNPLSQHHHPIACYVFKDYKVVVHSNFSVRFELHRKIACFFTQTQCDTNTPSKQFFVQKAALCAALAAGLRLRGANKLTCQGPELVSSFSSNKDWLSHFLTGRNERMCCTAHKTFNGRRVSISCCYVIVECA